MNNENLSFLDLLEIMSFVIGVMNLDMNITQDDMSKTADAILNEIHSHLQEQDEKIDFIIQTIAGDNNDGR